MTKSKLNIIIVYLLVVIGFTILQESCKQQIKESKIEEKINNGIDKNTGLIIDDGYKTVIQNCLSCHSSKIITQNRATREGWLEMIQWMQKNQKLWTLGANEDIILNYLSKNYAPKNKGRRVKLTNVEWYLLKE